MNKISEKKEKKVLNELSKNILSWYSYWGSNIERMRNDKYFTYTSQWTDSEVRELTSLGKPVMQFNKLNDYVNKRKAEYDQNTPSPIVRGRSNKVPSEIVSIAEQELKNIFYKSNSDICFQTSFENALFGFGAISVFTDYKDSYSFDLEIKIKSIENPERCFFDPSSKHVTKRDGNFCGEYVVMNRDEFEKEYPEINAPSGYDGNYITNYFYWFDSDMITVVHYYRKEFFFKDIYLLDNGQSVDTKQLKVLEDQFNNFINEENQDSLTAPYYPKVINKRKTKDYKIWHYKCIADHVLECSVFPSKFLPIVYQDGNSKFIDGVQVTSSYIGFAKDAQRLHNYIGVDQATKLKNMRGERFMGTPDNVSGDLAQIWRNPENQQGILLANPDPVTGAMPMPLPTPELPQSYMAFFQQTERDIASILGMYDPKQGAGIGEISGVAIEKRMKQGSSSSYVYNNNAYIAMEQTCRVILDMMKNVYDSERDIESVDEAGNPKSIKINEMTYDGNIKNDMSKGDYVVEVYAGPSFPEQKQEQLKLLMQLGSLSPKILEVIIDLIGENFDIDKSELLSRRLATLLPKEIQELDKPEEEKEKAQQPMPNPMLLIEQKKLQIQEEELKTKQASIQADLMMKSKQHEYEMLKLQLEQDKLVSADVISRTKANAEIKRAEIDQKSSLIKSLQQIKQQARKYLRL
jgi:hypothetical protein